MKNRENLLFSILLTVLNSIGAVAAFSITLQMRDIWYEQPVMFLGGILLLSTFSVLFWRSRSKRRILIQGLVLLCFYGVGILIFRKEILNSLAWAMHDAVLKLNARYHIELVWNYTMDAEMTVMLRRAAVSFLAVLIPYFLLIGYGVMRSRVMAIILADALWFVTACGMDLFPNGGAVWLCVLGLSAVVIKKAYRDDKRAGQWAVLLGCTVMFLIMEFVSRMVLPVFDEKYEELLNVRMELSTKINEEWIPKLQADLARLGKKGVDVDGELTGKGIPEYDDVSVYRVTIDKAPKTAIYLKGFVGKDYSGDEWEPERDSEFERYYRANDWELPEDGGELVNLTFQAFRYGSPGYVRVEELAGKGSYSLYPCGAQLTEDYRVHWDGSAERKNSCYEFAYYVPNDNAISVGLTGEAAETEQKYRSYVYDNYREYPARQLPELTEFLENSGFRRGDVYESLADVLSYLRRNTSYNLEVGDTPKSEDFVEYFLFDSHEGYCAHFASAAVLMLRYLGVPARYATGYSVSANAFSRTADGDYSAVILDRQAHAWVEVYLDEVGWIPVEMTPGAVAFSRDNTMEQLQFAGQLSGAFEDEKESVPEISNAAEEESGEDEKEVTQEKDSESETSTSAQENPEKGSEETDGETVKRQPGNSSGKKSTRRGTLSVTTESGQTGSGTGSLSGENTGIGDTVGGGSGMNGQSGESSGTGNLSGDGFDKDDGQNIAPVARQDTEFVLRKNSKPEKKIWELPPAVKTALKVIAQIGFGLFLCAAAVYFVRRSFYGRLCKAEDREKIFLLYRNLKLLLWISGHGGRLRGQEADEFRLILEKSSFGEKGPSNQELRRAIQFYRKLAGEEYSRLPFYKKPVFKCFNVY